MENFWLWFSTGLEHITDLGGYDHILFVALLSISFSFSSWKKLLVMITAFTVGHSISLAVSVIGDVSVNTTLIEFLIAFSIFITALYQFLLKENKNPKWIYVIVVIFGLIHGTGFSYLLKSMLGKEETITFPLIYFNLGLEAGQLLIVLFVLGLNFVVSYLKLIDFKSYKMIVVATIGLIAIKMCVERMFDYYSSN